MFTKILPRAPRRAVRPLLISALILTLITLFNPSGFAQSSNISFGYGNAVFFVDPDGRNQVSFSYYGADTEIDLALYALPKGEFMDRYAELNGSRNVDVSGLTQVVTWQRPVAAQDRNAIIATRVPDNVASGLYVLTATDTDQNGTSTTGNVASALVVVSRHALVLKMSDQQIVAWASHVQSGTPTPGMDVTLYDTKGAELATATTDDDGIAHFDITLEGDLWGQRKAYAVGEIASIHGGETTLAGLGYPWYGDVYLYGSGRVLGQYNVYHYTDRPLYRPGDKIHYVAVARTNDNGVYAVLPDTETVTATLHDARKQRGRNARAIRRRVWHGAHHLCPGQ